MTASDWAAWIGAVTGVLALAWEIVRWFSEGARLQLQTSSTMRLNTDGPNDPLPRPALPQNE